jgi:hypothetical protein
MYKFLILYYTAQKKKKKKKNDKNTTKKDVCMKFLTNDYVRVAIEQVTASTLHYRNKQYDILSLTIIIIIIIKFAYLLSYEYLCDVLLQFAQREKFKKIVPYAVSYSP